MQIRELIEKAGISSSKIVLNRPEAEIRDVASECPGVPENDVLYMLSEIPAAIPPNLVLSSPVEVQQAENCILLPDAEESERFSHICSGLLLEERRIKDKRQLLVSSIMSCRTLPDLLKKAAAVLGCCIAALDASLNIIDIENGMKKDLLPDWAVPGHTLPESAAELFKMKQLRLQMSREHDGILSCGIEAFSRNALISSFDLHEIQAGFLVLTSDAQTDVEKYRDDLYYITRFAANVYHPLFVPSVKNSALVLSDLLITEVSSQQQLESRLINVGFQPLGEYYIAVIDLQDQPVRREQASELDIMLGNLFPTALRTVQNDRPVLLFSQRPNEDNRPVLRKLADFAESHQLKAGVSHVFFQLCDGTRNWLPHFYRQAEHCLMLSSLLQGTKGPVYLFQDCAIMEMLNIVHHNAVLMDFCHPLLYRLLRYDEENSTSLMDTLYTWLEQNCNTQLAAAELYIHKNTLLYRLDRLRDILGTDLTNRWELFNFQFSFRILIYLEYWKPGNASK